MANPLASSRGREGPPLETIVGQHARKINPVRHPAPDPGSNPFRRPLVLMWAGDLKFLAMSTNLLYTPQWFMSGER